MRLTFYGACAIVLGFWEATAYVTDSVPTVTATCRRLHACPRRGRATRLAVLAWTAGLALHLLAPGKAR